MEFQPDSVVLSDGRRLAFAVLGPPTGYPVVYLHGGIGTALTPDPGLIEAVEREGVQWVALSRPGFGRSDPHAGRTMQTVARDVAELAAARGWPRIAVVGVSSGAPYALACAAELPELVAAVAIAAGLSGRCAPHRVPGLPRTVRAFLAGLVAAPRASVAVLSGAARLLRCTERIVVWVAGADRAQAVHALVASVEHGVRGPVEDFVHCARPWEFDPASITTEVHLWHGLRDRIAPPEHAWQLAAALPRCSVWMSPSETHFFFRRRSAEIAAELVAAARAAGQPARCGRPAAAHAAAGASPEPGRSARRGEMGGRADRVRPGSGAEARWICHPGVRAGRHGLSGVAVQPDAETRSWRSAT